MDKVPELAATFLANTRVRFVPPTPTEAAVLEQSLAHAWEDARAHWPGVELPPVPFVIHVAQRLPESSPQEPIAPLLAKMSLPELYLACACLQGMDSAHQAFERNYLALLPKKLQQPAALMDDVCQLVRVKLLVTTPESTPKIGEYTGRGALLNWVLITAGRIANKLREDKPTDELEDIIDVLPGPGMDPELDSLKRLDSGAFRQAAREVFSSLAAEDRYLLRLRFADQRSTYELALLFRVNQSTISRWLKSARQHVYEETRRQLQARLDLSTRDFNSYWNHVRSQLDMSISQLLGKDDKDDDDKSPPSAAPSTSAPPSIPTPPPTIPRRITTPPPKN